MNHDIVVIGTSAGGVEVLLELAKELPADLDAAIFVVIHMPAGHTSALPDLLSKRGPLPARHPLHEETIEKRTIYVAPPDMHMQLRRGVIEVVRGPRDNGFRPAADQLFRTASMAYGSRVIGVVLTGYQDCGTAGMLSVKSRGGIAIVQDPETALAPAMPRNVLEKVKVDYVIHPMELPALIARLVDAPAGPAREPDLFVQQVEGTVLGQRAEIVCPICEGALTEAQPGVFQHFRCHVGHAFTLETLVREQSEEMERVLWAAVRALEESASLAERIAANERGALKQRFEERALTHRKQAEYIRAILLQYPGLSPEDAARL